MKRELSETEVLHRAAAYCSAGERCIQDVEKRILAAGLPEEACRRIIARLQQEGFVDERRFARCFVNDKLRFNKWGRIKIGYEMQKKGIAADIRAELLESISERDYEEMLYALLQSKKRSARGRDERDLQVKLFRFAAGRGFEGGVISRCLKRLFDGETTYEEDLE